MCTCHKCAIIYLWIFCNVISFILNTRPSSPWLQSPLRKYNQNVILKLCRVGCERCSRLGRAAFHFDRVHFDTVVLRASRHPGGRAAAAVVVDLKSCVSLLLHSWRLPAYVCFRASRAVTMAAPRGHRMCSRRSLRLVYVQKLHFGSCFLRMKTSIFVVFFRSLNWSRLRPRKRSGRTVWHHPRRNPRSWKLLVLWVNPFSATRHS